jgi:hypothetical protein
MLWFEISNSAATHSRAIVEEDERRHNVVPETTQHSAITSTTARIGQSTMSRYSLRGQRGDDTRQDAQWKQEGRKRIATSAAVASATPADEAGIILRLSSG